MGLRNSFCEHLVNESQLEDGAIEIIRMSKMSCANGIAAAESKERNDVSWRLLNMGYRKYSCDI